MRWEGRDVEVYDEVACPCERGDLTDLDSVAGGEDRVQGVPRGERWPFPKWSEADVLQAVQ